MRFGRAVRLGLALGMFAVAGCSGSSTIELSGDATHGGKPIPAGVIYFTPDSSKGNKGPDGFAEIRDGRYDTRKEGHAVTPGATIVKIDGNDGSRGPGMGVPLFDPYSIKSDIPAGTSTQSFDVPASQPKTRKVPAKQM